MAIGDTWETINTYAFTDGTTLITADFLNDTVNDLEYLYNRDDSKVNAWTENTNTNVTIAGSTSDVVIGLSLTFTPDSTSVMCILLVDDGGATSDYGYKVNSGAITYLSQDYSSQKIYMFAITGLTSESSNTITFYGRRLIAGSVTMQYARAILWEMAN